MEDGPSRYCRRGLPADLEQLPDAAAAVLTTFFCQLRDLKQQLKNPGSKTNEYEDP